MENLGREVKGGELMQAERWGMKFDVGFAFSARLTGRKGISLPRARRGKNPS
jgi:hypothetical protein